MGHTVAARHATRITVVGLNYAPEPTGIAPYTTGICEALSARGHDVTAVTGLPHYPQWKIQGSEPRTEVRNGVALRRVRHYVPKRPFGLRRVRLEVSFGIRSLFRSWNKPESLVFVSPALISTLIGTIKARVLGISYSVWVQDIYSLGIKQVSTSRLAQLLSRVERSVLKNADQVVVIHDRFRRYISTELDVPHSRIRVVRNWSHVAPQVPTKNATRSLRESYGWTDNDVVVVHAGNMGAKQGLINVIDASRIAAERGSAVRFVFVGDGNMREMLEQDAVGVNVQFIDPLPVEQFDTLLASADVLLVSEVPGLTEMSVPSKLTTYFATGVPVLASVSASSVTADEMVAAGAGPRVDPDDPKALVDAAEWLARTDTDARARFGLPAQRYCRSVLSDHTAIDSLENLLISSRTPGNPAIGIPVTR